MDPQRTAVDQSLALPERRFPCHRPGCTAIFTKGEHLKRHERGHTGSRPYTCPTCDRRFGRQDSLTRHCRSHLVRKHVDARTTSQRSGGTPKLASTDKRSGHVDKARDGVLLSEAPLITDEFASHPQELSNTSIPVFDLPTVLSDAWDGPLTGPFNDNLGVTTDFDFQEDEIFSFLLDPLTMPTFGSQPQASPAALTVSTSQSVDSEWLKGSADAGRKALSALNTVVRKLPESLAATTPGADHPSAFFEDCVDLFFCHSSTFAPVMHRPTFNPRECDHATLLYILALGSCFLPYAVPQVSHHRLAINSTILRVGRIVLIVS
jgi:hypothetical protein